MLLFLELATNQLATNQLATNQLATDEHCNQQTCVYKTLQNLGLSNYKNTCKRVPLTLSSRTGSPLSLGHCKTQLRTRTLRPYTLQFNFLQLICNKYLLLLQFSTYTNPSS